MALMKKLALAAFLSVVSAFLSPAWAQVKTQSGGSGCPSPTTVGVLGFLGTTATDGTFCTITDGVTASDCATGGGTMTVTCWFCDGSWQKGSCGAGSAGGSVSDKHPEAAIVPCADDGDIGKVVTLEDNGVFQACVRSFIP